LSPGKAKTTINTVGTRSRDIGESREAREGALKKEKRVTSIRKAHSESEVISWTLRVMRSPLTMRNVGERGNGGRETENQAVDEPEKKRE